MDLGLRDHVYIVSGASQGLGLATTKHLVADGAKVVLCSRDEGRVTAAAESLGNEAAVGVPADLAAVGTADTLVGTALQRFGRLDGAVISVGGPPPGAVADVTDDAWRHAFESVFLGPLRLARTVLAAERLNSSNDRSVTFILSTSVRSPVPGLAISNGLRPGLAMVAKTLADEHGPNGCRINVVLPGRIDTARIQQLDEASGDADNNRARSQAQIPLRRYGTPEEFGRVVAFVASPGAAYINGTALTVDGGMTRSI